MMENKTPVEYLEEIYHSRPNYEQFILSEEFKKAKEMEKEQIIEELKIIGNAFNVETLDSREHRHHIRFTSIIKDRINYYFNILLKLKNK